MARAIVRHKSSLEALRGLGEHRLTRMLATIHDALITETASANAEEVLSIMRKDMILGYRDIFPDAPTDALVEGGVGLDWSALG